MPLPSYNIRQSPRAKNLRLKVTPQEGLCVVVPRGFDERRIPRILQRKKDWIADALADARKRRRFLERKPAHLPDQTVAFVLAERGVLPDQKLSLGKDGDWRAVFSAVREMLGIDKRARSKRRFVACEEVPAETLRCEPLPVFVDSPSERRELNASYRQRLARHYGYARSLAFAAFTADRTRTRKSTYHKVIRTLAAHIRAAFREIGQPLFEGVSEDARFVRDLRLRKYLANGEAILTAEALRPPTRFERTGFQAEAFANF
jgi:hypothetical protein